MKNLFKIFIFFVCIYSQEMNAQNDLLNQKKYWYYHYRLVNDFMIKGDCKGCSLPMTERAYLAAPKGKWGDATINLANYISVLASEYRLLKDNNQPTDTTLQELSLALKTFNRLDNNAESYFRCLTCTPTPLTGDLNGFFIRDDVDMSLLNDHPTKLANGIVSNYSINTVESDFTDPNPVLKEMSHDQIWHLFIGLALVSELLNDNPMSQFPLNDVDGNTDIRQEAKNIADRIMNHIRNQDGPPSLKWTIINPVTNNNVDRGAFIGELAYGAAEAACFIRNGNTNLDIGYPAHTCNEYHDLESYAASTVWYAAGLGIGALYSVSAEDNKLQNLAAVGHSWRTSESPLLALNVTEERLGVKAILRDYQHIMLVHQVLHGGTNPIEQAVYLNLLNTAPCEGPYNFDFPDNSSSFEWSTENRLLYPQRRGEHLINTLEIPNPLNPLGPPLEPAHFIGEDKNVQKGEYNGLDYMLYQNLYFILNGNPSEYINYMDRVITFPFPAGPFSNVGTLSSPATIEAFHTITASNIINDNADVTYRAGLEISLLPGFEVHAGANFHAYIDPFECASDGEYRNVSSNSNDSSLSPTENLVAYNGPTTYIDYPKIVKPSESHVNSSTDSKLPPIVENEDSMNITPNPNNGSFQITIARNEKPVGVKKIKVYDIMGKIIWENGPSTNSIFNIDITEYAKGIYYVKSINEYDEMEMKKLIKQ